MFSPAKDPFRVKTIEIRDVERVENAPVVCGKFQLFVVGSLDETGVQRRDRRNATGTESRDKIAVHRLFVGVDLDQAH